MHLLLCTFTQRHLHSTHSKKQQTRPDLRRTTDMASRVAALLLLGLLCFGFAAADVAKDCCLQAVDKKVPHQLVVSYSIQEAGQGCSISATVLLMRSGKRLCVFHPDDSSVVKFMTDAVDKRKH